MFWQYDGRRRSETTISSYDEAPTPSSSRSRQRPFEIQIKPVEGPTGPHLFRASQSSGEFAFDHALQMSPLLPKEPPFRTETAFSQDTVTPISRQQHSDHSIAATLQQSFDSERGIEDCVRNWSAEQVIDWMCEAGMDPFVIECFEIHDINGTVLMDLQFDDLKELDIPSFGKRHQLWNAISDLRGGEGRMSPTQTPFQDTSRPCTRDTHRSPSRTRSRARNGCRSPSRGGEGCETPVDGGVDPITSGGKEKKRRGRKQPKGLDVITPAESVSIVAIEQLLPKPHKCAKGERCAKWRKQQRQMKQLTEEHGLGRFPVSPGKGGRVFVAGDPGNAMTAENIVPNVRKPAEEPPRPTSEAVPSVVASSDLLGPGQLPEFALHADVLQHLESRDPQDNVKQFLNFQHLNSPSPPVDQAYSPGSQTPRNNDKPLEMFPAEHVQIPSAQHPRTPMYRPSHTAPPPEQLKHLPRLSIPRAATAQPQLNNFASPDTANSICRSATASPSQVYRFGTPASEMDVPVTAVPIDPVGRDTSSQSVPPGMQYRDQVQLSRSASRADWRRPSFAMPALQEGRVFETAHPNNNAKRPAPASRTSSGNSTSADSETRQQHKTPDPAHHDPETKYFGYGSGCTHAGWMRKRKTRMLRHEWQDAHFRLRGTQLAMHANARLSAQELDNINVDDYAVACSSVASGSKLSAAFKSFGIKNDNGSSYGGKGKGGNVDPAPFAFQLVPSEAAGGDRVRGASGKTHHFAVKTKDERIDWMRELMLAKALQQKGKGFEVEINGVQA